MESEVYPELLVKVEIEDPLVKDEIEDPSSAEISNKDLDDYHDTSTNDNCKFSDLSTLIKAEPGICVSDGNDPKYLFKGDSSGQEDDELSCDEDSGIESNLKSHPVAKLGYGQFLKLNENQFYHPEYLGNQQQTRNDNSFSVNDSLEKEDPINTKKKPWMCSDCGKPYFQRSELLAHMRIHTGEKPFTCTECGKSFLRKSHLVRHLNIHTREKSLNCEICESTFSLQSELRAHMRIHMGEKPYVCSECGEAFTWKSRLIPHMRSHTGEKPFTCNECGKSFLRKSHHNAHVKIHSGEKPFICDCGKAFYRRSHLMLHKKSHRRKPIHIL